MTWILLLLQFLPTMIDIIMKIRELILELPRRDRATARREMHSLARRQVHDLTRKHVNASSLAAPDVEKMRQAADAQVVSEWYELEKQIQERIAHHEGAPAEPVLVSLVDLLQRAAAQQPAK